MAAKRTKRFLLVTAALSATAGACGKDAAKPDTTSSSSSGMNLPANPKGTFYDAGLAEPPPPPPPPPVQDAGPKPIPPPANPKGSHYDAGSHGGGFNGKDPKGTLSF